jgi:hypothetical protein
LAIWIKFPMLSLFLPHNTQYTTLTCIPF